MDTLINISCTLDPHALITLSLPFVYLVNCHLFTSSIGAVGTMAGLNHTARQQFLDYCPELKMLFPVLHYPDPSYIQD